MRVFRCDICAKTFDPRGFIPNQIVFIEDPIDPRYGGGEISMWLETKLPQPLEPEMSRAKYHICPNCFESIRDLLNKLSDQK